MANILRASAKRTGSLRSQWQRLATNNTVQPCLSSTSRFLSSEEASSPVGTAYSELTVGIPKENYPLEKRVAATPESVMRLVKPGFKVLLEDNAGASSYFSNAAYEEAGATIVSTEDLWKQSDIVMKVSQKAQDRPRAKNAVLTCVSCRCCPFLRSTMYTTQ